MGIWFFPGVKRLNKQRLFHYTILTEWYTRILYNRFINFYNQMVNICTTSLTFSISTFCPSSVFRCFVWILEQTAIISLYAKYISTAYGLLVNICTVFHTVNICTVFHMIPTIAHFSRYDGPQWARPHHSRCFTITHTLGRTPLDE